MLFSYSGDSVFYATINWVRKKFVPGEHIESDETPENMKSLGFEQVKAVKKSKDVD